MWQFKSPFSRTTGVKGVARIWFRGGGHPFRGGGPTPYFRLRPQITRVPPYVLLATPGFRGGRPPPPPPPLATPLTGVGGHDQLGYRCISFPSSTHPNYFKRMFKTPITMHIPLFRSTHWQQRQTLNDSTDNKHGLTSAPLASAHYCPGDRGSWQSGIKRNRQEGGRGCLCRASVPPSWN